MMQESRPDNRLIMPGPLDAVARNIGRRGTAFFSMVAAIQPPFISIVLSAVCSHAQLCLAR